mmetsp:Transcript_29304/g.53119  ORF Transcript_29304/g.53119 Transcript_29304/m.53119 type:complete len:213 (-) Transcript_29304:1020-1658(-)
MQPVLGNINDGARHHDFHVRLAAGLVACLDIRDRGVSVPLPRRRDARHGALESLKQALVPRPVFDVTELGLVDVERRHDTTRPAVASAAAEPRSLGLVVPRGGAHQVEAQCLRQVLLRAGPQATLHVGCERAERADRQHRSHQRAAERAPCHNAPFVDGITPAERGSSVVAMRNARPKALKMVSAWWWALWPFRLSMCTVASARLAKPWKNS